MTFRTLFWIKWAARDLRDRWLQVLAIALIIGLGTGLFAGLGSNAPWREDSYDASYSLLNMYDLRLALDNNVTLPQDDLLAALAEIDGVGTVEGRLTLPTLVEVTSADEDVLVTGRVWGVDISEGGPHINQLYLEEGRDFRADDGGGMVAALEYKFARYYGFDPADDVTLSISGGVELDFIATVQTPEYFQVIPESGGVFLGESSFAPVFVPLATAQQIAGHEGEINNVVMTLADDADVASVERAVEELIASEFDDVSITLTRKSEDPVRDRLYTDVENDEVLFMAIALVFLFGAALAAFNLIGRMVESMRRQIGIGMALGVPTPLLALRPLLAGAQIALLGVIAGLLFGLALSAAFGELISDVLVVPVWQTDFQTDIFAQAALLGFAIPFVATIYPVLRAVRVHPIDAIKTGHLVAKGGGLAGWLKDVPLPGRSLTEMPLRNILRAPWRSGLTALGIGVAVVIMAVILGLLNSINETVDTAQDAYAHTGDDRLNVLLNDFYPPESERVSQITALAEGDSPVLTTVEPGLEIGGRLSSEDHDPIDIQLTLLPSDSAIWTPKLLSGTFSADGIVISKLAADDLGLAVGDTVTARLPQRRQVETSDGPRTIIQPQETTVTVAGIHTNPFRFLAYMDLSQAEMMGFDGVVNALTVVPTGSTADVKQQLFTMPAVASVSTVDQVTDSVGRTVELLTSMIVIAQGFALMLAFLIAYNSTSINLDDRRREIATMLAFGLQVPKVLRMQVLENAVIGLAGTVVGIAVGYWVLDALMGSIAREVLPDLRLIITMEPLTVALALLFGVLVVALTPLLSVRRMQTMNLPNTLRVME
jgi:putative ABC transport system permease protein